MKRKDAFTSLLLIVGLISIQVNPVTAIEPRAPTRWYRTIIDKGPGGPTETTGALAIGIGRNDNVKRLYCANSNNGLQEYSYSGGLWNKVTITTGKRYESIVIGNARGDGVNRLYCFTIWTVDEVFYSGGNWTVTTIFNGTSDICGAFFGIGRNDGVVRLYISERSGNITELRYQSGAWTITGTISQGVWGEALGPGRNDGVNRIYGGWEGDYIYELSYEGGAWVKRTVGQKPNSDPFINETGNVTLANGQNDGLLRVFYQGVFSDIHYFSYNGGSWSNTSVAAQPIYFKLGFKLGLWTPSWAIGPGRNDGYNRIFVAGDTAKHNPNLGNAPDTTYLHEYWYAFGPPPSWDYNPRIGWTGLGGAACVRIGDGRNSGKQRVYTADGDGTIVEYSWGL